MHTCRSFQNIGIAIISCGALFPEARAGTVTYLGSGTLSGAANWDTAARPVTTDEALFINALPDPVTTAGGTNLEFGNFLWNSNSSSTIALNTTGSTSTQLRLTNGGGSTAAIANGGATDDLLLLGRAATSNTVIISGNLNTGTAQLEIFLQAAGNINVVNAGATLDIATRLRERNGVFGFNKTGAGTLILRGTNTYTGTTTLSEGTLALRNSNALSSGALTINGGTLASTRHRPHRRQQRDRQWEFQSRRSRRGHHSQRHHRSQWRHPHDHSRKFRHHRRRSFPTAASPWRPALARLR